MAKIFLSYRREDSAGVAGRIYDRLRVPFGPDSVFFDVDSVPFGVDFQEHIESVFSHCDVFLAVIGPDWAGKINTGRRIDDPRDWVRIEVEAALKRGLPVIPVLIDHTRMPSEADLPPSLVRLARRTRSVWTKDGTSTFMWTDSSEVLNSSALPIWFKDRRPSRRALTTPSQRPHRCPPT